LRDVLNLPAKIEARKAKSDDGEVVLVYWADGEIARHLVLDANTKLADEHEGQDKLLAAQMEIKRRISKMQLRDPSKSFRQCWEKLQRSEPKLFEDLP
jgi:hypothetical protein